MRPKTRWNLIAQLIAVLLCGAAIKFYYATAGVDELLWILGPTRSLVELASGVDFVYESGAGYMSSDHSFLIAPSCSGVNFLITAFLMLTIGRLWRNRSGKTGWSHIPVSLVAAYLTTLAANTVRISTALYFRRQDPELIWLNPDQFHRFEGIVVYFGFLLLIFVANEKMMPDSEPIRPRERWRRWLLPLAVYYGTTLGVPVVNAMFKGGLAKVGFWEHSIFVVLVPLLLLGTVAAANFVKDLRPDLRVRNIY